MRTTQTNLLRNHFFFFFLTFSFASAIISLLIVNVHVKKSLFSTSTWFHTLWPSAALTGHNCWPPQHQKLCVCLVSSNTYSSWVLRHRDSQEVKRRFLTRWKFLRALLDCLWMYSDQLGKKISWGERTLAPPVLWNVFIGQWTSKNSDIWHIVSCTVAVTNLLIALHIKYNSSSSIKLFFAEPSGIKLWPCLTWMF